MTINTLVNESITAIHSRPQNGRRAKVKNLPFVRKVFDDNGKKKLCYWAIKETGDYQTDKVIGQYYAVEALQLIKDNEDYLLLGKIARDMPREPKHTGVQDGFWQAAGWKTYQSLVKYHQIR